MNKTRIKEIIAVVVVYLLLGLIISGSYYFVDGESFSYSMQIYHISLALALFIWFLIIKLCDWTYRK